MTWSSGISKILTWELKAERGNCFILFMKFKNLFISLPLDVWLWFGLNQKTAFQISGQVANIKKSKFELPTCDSWLLNQKLFFFFFFLFVFSISNYFLTVLVHLFQVSIEPHMGVVVVVGEGGGQGNNCQSGGEGANLWCDQAKWVGSRKYWF